MGIDAMAINTIKEEIETYLQGVDEIIAKINTTNTNVNVAFKGDAQMHKVKEYLDNSVNTIKGVTAEMRKFIEALDRVRDNYSTQSSSINVTAINEAGLNVTTGVHGFGD